MYHKSSNVYYIFNVYNRYYCKGKKGCRDQMHLGYRDTLLTSKGETIKWILFQRDFA